MTTFCFWTVSEPSDLPFNTLSLHHTLHTINTRFMLKIKPHKLLTNILPKWMEGCPSSTKAKAPQETPKFVPS